MKNRFLFLTFLILTNAAFAQPWMPKSTTGNGPLKYKDAINSYRNYLLKNGEEKESGNYIGKEEKDNKNHLFERWNYYWKNHLDNNGYLVPPVKNILEWEKYLQSHSNNSNRTSSLPSNWVFQGPNVSNHGYSGIGRINTVAFHPTDSNTIYVGSAAGSTWKTTDGGTTWVSLYDYLPALGVADIKINPLNPNTVYVATGDGDHGDTYSSGVIISHDGGAHWSTSGLTWLPTAYNNARSLLINPQDTSTLILAADAGIFISHNCGFSWVHVFTANFKQILFKPGDTTILYGTIYTDTASQIMRSTDAGHTWHASTSFTDAQRINIAVCPASPNIVKAIASDHTSGLKGVYNSTDNGATYTAIFTEDSGCTKEILGYTLGLPTTSCGGQGWYDLCIAINPTNANDVIVGGVNTYYSSDGGNSWTIANTWYGGLTGVATVHADKHCLAYNPITVAVFETCDGGVYKNNGPLTSPWTDLTDGICITEFYRNAVDNNATFCIGGAQDNGTKMVDAGFSTFDLTGGDGMQPLINYGNPNNIWYCAFQNGSIDMTRDGGANYHSITDTLHTSGGWVSPYVIHPTDTQTLILGFKRVYVSHNNGISWTPISPIFDSNSYLDRIAVAKTNPNYIYASYYDYTVWAPKIKYSTNFGVTWDTIIIPFSNSIADLKIDPVNEKHIWAAVSGYGSPKIYDYNLISGVWTDQTGTLPDMPVECIFIDTNTKTKYIGTDAGVFFRDTTMSDWALFNTHLPSVHVADLHVNYTTNELWAATFGRGMWKTVKADHAHTLDNVSIKLVNESVSLFPNPTHGMFTISFNGDFEKNEPVKISLYTCDGKKVLETIQEINLLGNINIQTKGISSGLYICEVSAKEGTYRNKLTIY